MAFVQTAYSNDFAKGFPGLVAFQETSNRISRIVEDAAGIAYGRAVFQGANGRGVTATPSANFMGVTIAHYGGTATSFPSGNTDPVYAQTATAGVLEKGVIWVNAAVAVTARQPVYVTAAGAFTNVTSGNTALGANVTFDDTITAAGLVRVRIK